MEANTGLEPMHCVKIIGVALVVSACDTGTHDCELGMLMLESLFPELKLIKDKKLRRKTLIAASEHKLWLTVTMIVLLGAVWFVLRDWFRSLGDGWEELSQVAYVWFTLGVGVIYFPHFVYRSSIAYRLRKEINKLGISICIRCGYQLRGLVEPRCPECGRPVDSCRDELNWNSKNG